MIKTNLLKISFLSLLILGGTTMAATTLKAQETLQKSNIAQTDQATDEETVKPTESLEETTDTAIKEIKKRIEENTSKVKGALDEMFNTQYGMAGEVQRINDDAITFKNTQGTTILAIPKDVGITKKSKDILLTDIAVGNWITVLGYKEAEDFIPKVILVSETSLRPDTQLVLLGLITDISTKKVTITDRSTGAEHTFDFTKTTQVEDLTGEEASISDFEKDVSVLLVATTNEDGEFEVRTMRSLAPLDELN